ncbi:MAG: selenocysteine lyase [Desulfuromonas sp. SDB]|nr:MAG: selenocysteine lyase [Desulfuromonas sp. SDB]
MNQTLEQYFSNYRKNIIGLNYKFKTPFGSKQILYADWAASGRLYRPIEQKLIDDFGPFVANTHTETTVTGTLMTRAYHYAQKFIKEHVNAGPDDRIINFGSGMTGVVSKFQRILGLKLCDKFYRYINIPESDRPVVFLTHMEHHSNQTTWLETICDVEIINADNQGLPDLNHFEHLCNKYNNRKLKIASVTACSNVTGIQNDIYSIAEIIHRYQGLCFVDYACSAPYVAIDMHPQNSKQCLDAVFFSPHKFLGGPGSAGILIFNRQLYDREIPDQPGGGTVAWTNPWGQHKFFDDIEIREDGGTPAFLQTIKASLAVKLKEQMGIDNILKREHYLVEKLFKALSSIDQITILQQNLPNRLGVISFNIRGLHYNLGVKLLNDLYGIQSRGGCSCAGTYGHYLLGLDKKKSQKFTEKINNGDLSLKPGWIRVSLHPTITDQEVDFILDAVENIARNYHKYQSEYSYSSATNEYTHINFKPEDTDKIINRWFR